MTLALLQLFALLLGGVFNAVMAYEAHGRQDPLWRRLIPLLIALGLLAAAASKFAALA
ncbi:hypothetical protein [Porphyrobacter sp. HT-58-2]|uniref:hypothetical protein n=1 Tax=Porphyrobacter sp. HT-58-2 TaxID=2023229 RepID=UPI001559A852|nr:hypothetical protein [Porphyrobacter sp. HT-58-2]